MTSIVCAAAIMASLAMSTAAAPASGFTIQSGPAMKVNRMGHYCVTLPDGRAVLFGGHGTNFVSLNTAEIFTPAADSFTVQTMNAVHDGPAFARLADGRYLIAGGAADLGVAPGNTLAEIFDPSNSSFTAVAAQMIHGRMTCGAATLSDSTVLIVGGWYDSASASQAEVFSPKTGTFTAAGSLSVPRAWPLVVPTSDGKAVVFGGIGIFGASIKQLVELYNPVDKSFGVLDSSIFGQDTGWNSGSLESYDRSMDQQKLRGGAYLFFADSGSAYQLFTFDPSSKVFAKVGAAITDTTVSLTPPIVDTLRSRAYIIGEKWCAGGVDSAPIQLCCYVVNTSTWAAKAPTGRDTLPPSYFISSPGFSMLNDGRILMSGGNSETGYNTNFSPIDSTRILVPDTSAPTGIRFGRVSVQGEGSKLYSVRPVAGGIRFHSSIRENLTISLTSISGRTVAVLFIGIVEPSISYDFPLGDKRLGTGVYYCSMKSATKTVSVRLALTK